MTKPDTRMRVGPIQAATLKAALPAGAFTLGRKPRQLTRLQRVRTWLRRLVGLPPLIRDLPWECHPMPENAGETVTFRRTLPPTLGDRHGLR